MAKPTRAVQETQDEMLRVCRINPEIIQEEFAQIPGNVARWAFRAAEAAEAHQRAEMEFEIGEADLKERHRNRLHGDGGKATIPQVDAATICDPEYRKLSEDVISAARAKADALAMVEALRAKRDMLISLGAHQRAEMDSHISVNERPSRR